MEHDTISIHIHRIEDIPNALTRVQNALGLDPDIKMTLRIRVYDLIYVYKINFISVVKCIHHTDVGRFSRDAFILEARAPGRKRLSMAFYPSDYLSKAREGEVEFTELRVRERMISRYDTTHEEILRDLFTANYIPSKPLRKRHVSTLQRLEIDPVDRIQLVDEPLQPNEENDVLPTNALIERSAVTLVAEKVPMEIAYHEDFFRAFFDDLKPELRKVIHEKFRATIFPMTGPLELGETLDKLLKSSRRDICETVADAIREELRYHYSDMLPVPPEDSPWSTRPSSLFSPRPLLPPVP